MPRNRRSRARVAPASSMQNTIPSRVTPAKEPPAWHRHGFHRAAVEIDDIDLVFGPSPPRNPVLRAGRSAGVRGRGCALERAEVDLVRRAVVHAHVEHAGELARRYRRQPRELVRDRAERRQRRGRRRRTVRRRGPRGPAALRPTPAERAVSRGDAATDEHGRRSQPGEDNADARHAHLGASVQARPPDRQATVRVNRIGRWRDRLPSCGRLPSTSLGAELRPPREPAT